MVFFLCEKKAREDFKGLECPREPTLASAPLLYAQHETGPASNVFFDLHPVVKCTVDDTDARRLEVNNLRLATLPAERWTIYADGSVVPPSAEDKEKDPGAVAKSGWAVQLDLGDGLSPTVRTGIGGQYACSFTTETMALEGALALVEELPVVPLLPLIICTDSQGLLMSLAKGPCRQREFPQTRIWAALLRIASHRPIHLVFVFAHCGLEPHDRVDLLAKAAVASAPQPDVNWKDAARVAKRAAKQAHDSKAKSKGGFRSKFGPSGVSRPLRLPRSVTTKLMWLRTGVDPFIGGFRHGHDDPCPKCALPMNRKSDPSAVEHMLVCPSAASIRAAVRADSGAPEFPNSSAWRCQSLWEEGVFQDIIRYRVKFEE